MINEPEALNAGNSVIHCSRAVILLLFVELKNINIMLSNQL